MLQQHPAKSTVWREIAVIGGKPITYLWWFTASFITSGKHLDQTTKMSNGIIMAFSLSNKKKSAVRNVIKFLIDEI